MSCVVMLLMFLVAYAQEIKRDSISVNGGNQVEKNDSSQILSKELDQVKSQLNAVKKERQYEKIWKRKKYWKFGYDIPNIERVDGEVMLWETENAFSIQSGKTAYFHSKPVWGIIKFGIDYGMDMSYSKLKLKTIKAVEISSSTEGANSGSNSNGGFDDIVSDDPSGSILSLMGVDLGMHKFEYGMHVGPNISINPWNHLIVSTYFHAIPIASGIVENDKFYYGFSCAMSVGVSVSYKAISVGVEGLWSTIKYKEVVFDDEEGDEYSSEEDKSQFGTKDFKLKQKGPRFYIAIRF